MLKTFVADALTGIAISASGTPEHRPFTKGLTKSSAKMLEATLAGVLLLAPCAAEAAEIKVLSALGIMAVMEDLGPRFERTSGHKLAMTFATLTGIVQRVQDGETADVIVIPQQGIDGFVKAGKAAAANVTGLARSGIGVVVRKGEPKPDISSPQSLKHTLLATKSIAYTTPEQGGPTGTHVHKMLDRLGIAKDMKSKTIFPKSPGGAAVGLMVAKGEAEIGMHQLQELVPIADIEIVGPLPADLQNTLAFAAVVMNSATDGFASKALIDFLRAPEGARVIKAKGMEPDTTRRTE